MDNILFLKSIPLAQGLGEDQINTLAKSAKQEFYPSGRIIVDEYDHAQTFYIVKSGKVKMFKSSPEGKEQTLYIFNEGEIFCLCASFSDSIFPASAIALSDCTVLAFANEVMKTLAHKDPAILFNILFLMSCRLKDSMALIESLSLKDIPQRLASFLVVSGSQNKVPEGGDIELAITKRELSKILGTTPETLSRVLKKMADDGIIRIQGRYIKTIDNLALTRLAKI